MLRKSLILGVLCLFTGHCQQFNDFQLGDPFAGWSWHSRHNLFPDESQPRDVEEVTERDREPLGPNYQDPDTSATEEKPVLQPKPQHPSYNPSAIPGGVVDVDAGIAGFPSGVGFPSGDFGFSSFGSRYPAGSGLFGVGGFFGSTSDFKPWWKGSNVCIEREETTDDDEEDEVVESQKNETEATTEKVPNFFSTAISLSNCHQSENKYECITKINNHGVVKTFTVRYKCCYGFARTKGAPGCEKQLELKPLLETVDDLGAKEFRKLLQSTGLEDTFTNGNYTVFVPTDDALDSFNENMLELNNVDHKIDAVRRRRDVKNAVSSNDLVLSHAVAGFVDLSDLGNEDIIYSENRNSSIRINTYPTQNYDRMVTANCAPITKSNNLAKNGIVHVISRVAAPATHSILEIIKEHGKLSSLRRVLESTELAKNFKEDGHYTIFAPTDEAFDKLDGSLKQKILRGDACASSILQHHITAHTICSSAIIGNATTHNVENEILNMERTVPDNNLIIEDKAKIIESDIMATNGVIHLIDTILIPESALHINDALKNENLTKFYELIEKAGFEEEMDSLNNATLFAPSNEALESPEAAKYLEEIKEDKEKLRDLIRYHTVSGQLQSCDMNNNAMLKTNNNNELIRLNLYSTVPLFNNIINRATINCAKITGFDEKSCGSVIHEVSKLLVPPTKSILDLINAEEKYSKLSQIIKDTEVEKVLQDTNTSITFLAPTDETFAGIDEADLKTLTEDKEKANLVLRNHILTEVLCCAGVGPQSWGFNSLVPALSHQHHQVGRTGSHQIRIGRGVVTSCDNLATNGVVHTINKVLFPQRHHAPNFGGFFMFDF